MKAIRKTPIWRDLDRLFWFCVIWETVQGLIILAQYLNLKLAWPVPQLMPVAYLILLLYYVARKEVYSWINKVRRRKRGEIPFWSWWIFTLILFFGESLSRGKYKVPKETVEIGLYLTTIYGGSCISKLLQIHRTKRVRRREHQTKEGERP